MQNTRTRPLRQSIFARVHFMCREQADGTSSWQRSMLCLILWQTFMTWPPKTGTLTVTLHVTLPVTLPVTWHIARPCHVRFEQCARTDRCLSKQAGLPNAWEYAFYDLSYVILYWSSKWFKKHMNSKPSEFVWECTKLLGHVRKKKTHQQVAEKNIQKMV